MEVTFEKEYLRDMYITGNTTDKKLRFQPEIIRKYRKVIDIMISHNNMLELRKYNGLNYESLKGDKAGLSSVRVNNQYRIEFEEKTIDEQVIATICNIVELSNYYK